MGKHQTKAGLCGSSWCWRTTWLISFFPPTPASLPFAILTLVNAPYKRGFYCSDDSIRYPYRPDTITHGLMAGVTITTTVILVRREGLGGRGSRSASSGICGEEGPLWSSPFPSSLREARNPKHLSVGRTEPPSTGLMETTQLLLGPSGRLLSGSLCRCRWGRPIWCTRLVSIPAPTSTTTWQPSTRCWGPSCSGPR